MTTFKWNYMSALQHITYQTIFICDSHNIYSMRCFQVLIRSDYLIASEYHFEMVCNSSTSMRRAAGRVDHWDELSTEQGERTVRIPSEHVVMARPSRCKINQTFPNWNQFPISRNWWLPDIEKWFSEKNSRYSDINKCCSTYEHIHVFA